MKTINVYSTLKAVISTEYDTYDVEVEDYAHQLERSLEKENESLDSIGGFAKYFRMENLKRVTLQSVEIGTRIFLNAKCEVSDDWSDDDTDKLIDKLTGQYSDGWGEGFEQRPIYEYQDYDEVECEDYETGEIYYDEDYINHEVYVSPYQSRNFEIWVN